MHYKLLVTKNGRLIDKCSTHSTKRFLKNLRTINWKHDPLRVSLRVGYGKQLNNFGKLSYFYNGGEYENKTDLWLAFNAFAEKE